MQQRTIPKKSKEFQSTRSYKLLDKYLANKYKFEPTKKLVNKITNQENKYNMNFSKTQ